MIQDSSITAMSAMPKLSSRLLRYSYRGSQAEINSQTLEHAAEKALNDLYSPATFDCDCDDALQTTRARTRGRTGGSAGSTVYDVSCISLKSVCHNRVCAVVKWDALFDSSLRPREEKMCVSVHAGSTCRELSGRDICFEFDYNDEGSEASRCRASVGTEACRSCELCGLSSESEGTNGSMQFLAPDCSNVEGMESKKFTCEEVTTVDDFNNIAFQCPRSGDDKKVERADDPTATSATTTVTTTTTTTTAGTGTPPKVKTVGRPNASSSKSNKPPSSKSNKASKSAKSGSKRG
ncbi:hypothetical protein ACHAXS_003426 [Conticribra weissflogii]